MFDPVTLCCTPGPKFIWLTRCAVSMDCWWLLYLMLLLSFYWFWCSIFDIYPQLPSDLDLLKDLRQSLWILLSILLHSNICFSLLFNCFSAVVSCVSIYLLSTMLEDRWLSVWRCWETWNVSMRSLSFVIELDSRSDRGSSFWISCSFNSSWVRKTFSIRWSWSISILNCLCETRLASVADIELRASSTRFCFSSYKLLKVMYSPSLFFLFFSWSSFNWFCVRIWMICWSLSGLAKIGEGP